MEQRYCHDDVSAKRWGPYVAKRFRDLSAEVDEEGFPSLELLDSAWNELVSLLPDDTATPSVCPGDNSSVELIWHRGGWHIYLTFEPTITEVWMKRTDHPRTTTYDSLGEVRTAFLRILEKISDD